ncbi:S8 family serine peptidase [Nonomuraea sp. NPDC050022]|uniref:S8 family serine peptidase n=1 Tax=Nonomuraea sp. NPDC050022 TaxID=3364358 RepID=UPI0037940E69
MIRPLAGPLAVGLLVAGPLAAGVLVAGAGPSASDDVGSAARAGQWQLATLRLPEAWKLSRGAGVLVAVLDTGVNARHPDLAGAVVAGPDLTGDTGEPALWGHHGTAMASLIAGHGHSHTAPPVNSLTANGGTPDGPTVTRGTTGRRTADAPATRRAATGTPAVGGPRAEAPAAGDPAASGTATDLAATGTASDPAASGTAVGQVATGTAGGGYADSGIIGVAPAARVLSVRVTLENGDPLRQKQHAGGRDALAKGIRYAVDHGADVISMSLGGGSGSWEGSAAEEEAVQYAISHGAVLVASSGNDGDTTNKKNFPAAYPGVIAVGAVDRRLEVAPFSNRQDYLSVVAPGTGIVTADGADSYVVGDGTSSAAAMVAGIAALIKAMYPDLSPYHVRTAIEQGTRRRPADGYNRSYGHGVANALLALRAADRLARPATASAGAGVGTGGYFGDGPVSRPPASRAPSSRLPVVLGMVLLTAVMSARVLVRHRWRGRDVT